MTDMPDLNDDRVYKKVVRSWAMYDWANSAFYTTVVAVMFPPYFHEMAKASGLSGDVASAYWGYITSITMLVVAVIGPVLGAMADHLGRRKYLVAAFAYAGSLATASFIVLGETSWMLGAGLYMCAMACVAGSLIFYESLLPHISRPGDMDRVSAFGYALGYVGGGTLLVVNALWVMRPAWFFMPDSGFALKASFVSVAVWWSLFTTPFLRNVPDPAPRPTGGRSAILAGLSSLRSTFREIGKYRELVKFLVAFWFYNSGITSVILMAAIYAKELGMAREEVVLPFVLTQFVGVPASMAFASAAKRFGTKRMVLFGLCCYVLISGAAFFMQEVWHLYVLAVAVGLVMGGTQSLSRSLFGSMVPPKHSAEFFGFMSTSSKFAGVVGPFVFGFVTQLTGNTRWGVVSLIALFAIGIVSLLSLREKEAAAQAAA